MAALNERPGEETSVFLRLRNGEKFPNFSECEDEVRHGLGKLRMFGLFDEDAGVLTDFANEVALFVKDDIGVRWAICLIMSWEYMCTNDVITVVAMMAAKSPLFVYPANVRDKASEAHQKFRGEGSACDLTTLLNTYYRVEQVHRQEGAAQCAQFCGKHYLNAQAFHEARAIRSQLIERVNQLGWEFKQERANENAVTCAMFLGYQDRILTRNLDDRKKWTSAGRFFAMFPNDSLHFSSPVPNTELLLCIGLIWKTDKLKSGFAFNAITPEQVWQIVGDRVRVEIEMYSLEHKPLSACEVWYFGRNVLCIRQCALPPSTPVEAVREMFRRSQGAVPSLSSNVSPNLGWTDLAMVSKCSDLQARVALAWIQFPDQIELEGTRLSVTYSNDGRIELWLSEEQVEILSTITLEALPDSWVDREVIVVWSAGLEQPVGYHLDNLHELRELVSQTN